MKFALKVVELTAYQVRIPLRKPIRHASHIRAETDNVVIRCVLEDGTEGYGEGVPRDYVTGETIDTALVLLGHSSIADQLEGCADFPQAVALAGRLRLQPVPGDERDCQGNAARCALELALLDAYGKRFGRALSEVTPLVIPELHAPRDWVRYSGAITSANTFWKLRLAARRVQVFRFPQVKVKVGIAGHNDARRLRIIRSILGSKFDIRVDANEAWSSAQAAQQIRALEPYGISAVEQPVPHDQVAALREVRREIHTPIMLDESLCSARDAESAIANETCDLFNLRLSKCGGFIPSLSLTQLAQRHGLGYQLGCQIGETAILSAAGRHFACSVAGIRYAEGSYDRHLIREALGTQDLTFRWGGWAPALKRPGLGVEINTAALARVTIRKEAILG
jgi:muconate cycloisomerase